MDFVFDSFHVVHTSSLLSFIYNRAGCFIGLFLKLKSVVECMLPNTLAMSYLVSDDASRSVDVVEPPGSKLNTTVEQEVRDHGWRDGGYVVA